MKKNEPIYSKPIHDARGNVIPPWKLPMQMKTSIFIVFFVMIGACALAYWTIIGAMMLFSFMAFIIAILAAAAKQAQAAYNRANNLPDEYM